MKTKWILISAFILIVVSIFVFFSKKNADLPENFAGKWTTLDPRYADRYFELTKTTLTYGLGDGKEDIYQVSGVKKIIEDNNILYTIYYKNEDGLKFTRSFYYEPANDGKIRFKNQEEIAWIQMKNAADKENTKTD
jgi:hypothetical protein